MKNQLSELKIGDRVRVISSSDILQVHGIPLKDAVILPGDTGTVRHHSPSSTSVFFKSINNFWFFKREMLKLVRRAKGVQ
jgi:hypothetical protein